MALTEQVQTHIAEVVAAAPPLTDAQADRLRVLLMTPQRPESDFVAPFDLSEEMDEWTN